MGVTWTQLLTGTNRTKHGLKNIVVQLAAAGPKSTGRDANFQVSSGNRINFKRGLPQGRPGLEYRR
jgi:hypothetical protein